MLRRRAEAEAYAKAQEVEAATIPMLPGLRSAKHVKKWGEQTYAKSPGPNVPSTLGGLNDPE